MASTNSPKTEKSAGGEKPKARRTRPSAYTHDGHPLNANEEKFIEEYIKTGNGRQAYLVAYPESNAKNAGQNSYRLLNKEYIGSEISYRLEESKADSIADATEIMEYFSQVMRGEIKDAFGLDAPLGERTKAAIELAKRQIDIPQRLSGNEPPQLKIVLDWARDDNDNDDGEKTIVVENA